MDLGLINTRALVTGSSRGLGAAISEILSQEGASVSINARNENQLQKTADRISSQTNRPVYPIPGDLTDAETPQAVIETAIQKMGGLDILVCNTGGPAPARFDELDDDAWFRATNLLLMSSVRLIRAALPALRTSKVASILTVTSYAVKQPIPNLILSNAIRGAVTGLTKSLALELGEARIRVNSILPGWTETERVANLMADRAHRAGTTLEEEKAKQASGSPFGRMAAPDEFARAAVFLCSPAASYLTGVMLSVDGGMYKATY
jgi:3-oxoacyl-[acyl-carrier protein] reductase